MYKNLANALRFISIYEVKSANSGHLGMPLGMADVLTVLFRNFLIFDPANPTWANRDRFVLSGGHGSAILYALLYLTGYEGMTLKTLKNFRKKDSVASGHPEYNPSCGIEMTTGPLGQGFASSVGMAIEERLLNARLGDDCINHYTYVCVGDGDLMEGISHEAAALAGHLKLGRLIVLFDDNNITIDGSVDCSSNENVAKRFESYGWQVLQADGHDSREINAAIAEAREDDRPSIIMFRTKIGYGSPKEGTSAAHGGPLSEEEIEQTKAKLNWDEDEFVVPEYIEKSWKVIGARHHELCEKWKAEQEEKLLTLKGVGNSEVLQVLRELKKEYFISRPFMATRNISKQIIENVISNCDTFISGSCDLGSSTGCLGAGMRAIHADDFTGNYIHYGIREHAMGAIMNGICAGGILRTCGGTFLSFSDYMRPAIRLSALMKLPNIYVFSHDSIGVGEDGPTHQPVEQLASLRAMPGLQVFRPADALETVECWECALSSNIPSAIILSRQNLPSIRFSARTNLCAKGGYMLNKETLSCDMTLTLIATGSEVSLALEVKKMLNDAYMCANVISIPCWELFEQQGEEYKQQLLGDSLRIGIEAASRFGWGRYLRDTDLFFGVDDFGYSASASENYKSFGLTAINIFNKIKEKLNI